MNSISGKSPNSSGNNNPNVTTSPTTISVALENLKSKVNKTLVAGALLLIVGIVISLIPRLPIGPAWLQAVVNFALEQSLTFTLAGAITFIISLIVSLTIEQIKSIWEGILYADIENFIGEVQSKINSTADQVKSSVENQLTEIYTKSEELIQKTQLEKVLTRCDPEVIKDHLPAFFSKIYGPHCNNLNQSLYGDIQRILHPFLDPRIPIRTKYRKTINISNNKNGTVNWSEICSYNVHVTSLDDDYYSQMGVKEKISYLVNYGASSIVTDNVDTDGLPKDLTIKISVMKNGNDGGQREDFVFDLKEYFSKTPEERSADATLSVTHELDSDTSLFTIKIAKQIELDSHSVTIRVVENSTLSINDDFIQIRHQAPSHGADLTVALPDNWVFRTKRPANDGIWQVHNPEGASNVLVAHTDRWIFPGLVFYCDWKIPLDELKLAHQSGAGVTSG